MRFAVFSCVSGLRLCAAAALTLCACASGETGDNGGSATFGPAATTPSTDPTASGSATNTAPPADDDSGTEDSDGPDSAAATGMATATESGQTSGAATEAGTDSASEGPPSEQPIDGMYSDCLSAVECIGLTTCMTLLDGGGEVSDGFCTVGACMNAAASCDPAPGGTAMPFCFPIDQNGTPDNICALDCSGGAACPAGMECFELSAGSICA